MKKGFFQRVDFGLLIPIFILLILSLTTLFSINPVFFRSQLLFSIVGLIAFLLFAHVDVEMLRRFCRPIYIVSLLLLILLFLFGTESRGALRWFSIFGFQVQVSEILKPFLAVALASYLISVREKTVFTLVKTLLLALPVVFLIIREPDLGNGLIYLGVVLLTLLTAGFSLVWFATGTVLLLASLPVFWHLLHDYQRQRIVTFFNPTGDPLGSSYNVIQAIIAVGSGQLIGKGLGEGTQSRLAFLPERHTDFVFATLSENFGFLGGVIVMLCFLFLLLRIYRIAVTGTNEFHRMFAIIAFFLIMLQSFVNIGMNLGLLPVVGITLPLISYGGSSLLSTFILFGMLSSIQSHANEPTALEIR